MGNRKGFTILELVVVLMVGAILTGIAIQSISSVQGRTSVRQARNLYVTVHARARAQAVEFGQEVLLRIDPGGDSAWISRNDTTLEVVRFRTDLGVSIGGIESTLTVCMNARGFADTKTGCNNAERTLQFTQAGNSSSVTILPLGQVVY